MALIWEPKACHFIRPRLPRKLGSHPSLREAPIYHTPPTTSCHPLYLEGELASRSAFEGKETAPLLSGVPFGENR